MGIFAHQFYFKQGLPKVADIKKAFHHITGLDVQFYSIVHINELMTDEKDLLYHIRESRGNVIHAPYFSCLNFNHVYLGKYMHPGDKAFYLEYGGRKSNKYFYHAMIKTMLEVGGATYTNHIHLENETDECIEQFLEPYRPHTPFWMRIRTWDEMSDFEKERFNQ